MPLQIRIKDTHNVQAALIAAEPGTRIILPPGIYTEDLVIDKPLEITGDGRGGVVEFAASEGPCVTVTSPRTIIGDVHLAARSARATLLDIAADDVAVDECTLSGGTIATAVSGKNIVVNRCTITNGDIGLHLDRCSDVDVTDCTIANNATGVWAENLRGRKTRLIACDISNNTDAGLLACGTEYYGPVVISCRISSNGTSGVFLQDRGTLLMSSQIINNGSAGIVLESGGSVNRCEISGGQVGVAVQPPSAESHSIDLIRCTIHHVPVGIHVSRPKSSASQSIIDCRIHDTSTAAVRTTHDGYASVYYCRIDSNSGAGLEIFPQSHLRASQCLIVGNAIGMVVYEAGEGDVTGCVISWNGIGGSVNELAKVDLSYCRIQANSHEGLILAPDSTGFLMDCMIAGNGLGQIKNTRSKISISGDTGVDHLARRPVDLQPPSEITE